MRFIIVGAGAVGTSLAQNLVRDQHDVVLVERDEEHLDRAITSLDLEIVYGDGCNPEVLTRAGIQSADYIISVADVDEINITASLIAKLMNPDAKRIARIRDIHIRHPEISESDLAQYFDLIINPDQAASEYLLNLFKVPGAQEVFDFCYGKLRVIALPVTENSDYKNKTMSELREVTPGFPVLIIAIKREDELIVPRGGHNN